MERLRVKGVEVGLGRRWWRRWGWERGDTMKKEEGEEGFGGKCGEADGGVVLMT